MGLGIGLGGFVSGFQTGYGLRQRQDALDADAEDRKRRIAHEDQADAEHAQDRAYDLKQRARADDAQTAIDDIQNDAKAKFEEGVAAGTYKEADFDKFWSEYALPKMRHQLLLNGDMKGAEALQAWGDSEDAKKGSRLFAQSLLKAQAGDPAGALDDAIAAGKIKGYIDHDYDISNKEEIKDATGNVVGYRVTFKDGDGNEHQQDIATDDIPQVISIYANPEAAFQSQQARAAEQGKRQAELDDYRTKKGIDAAAEGDSKYRPKAIEVLRKRSEDAATAGDTSAVPFDNLPADQQEAAIQQEIDLQRGTRQAPIPTPSMVVDGQTGQQVPGLGQVPTSQAVQPKAVGLGQGAAPPKARLTNDQASRLQAATQMTQRGDFEGARRMLGDSGIPMEDWPDAVRPQATADPGLALPVTLQ